MELIGDYSLVICQDLILFNVSYVSQFQLTVNTENWLKQSLKKPLPKLGSKIELISTCDDAPGDWSYQLQPIQDPNGLAVTLSVNLGVLDSQFAYSSSNMTIHSIKPFRGLTGQKLVEVQYQSESGQKSRFTLSLVFGCPDTLVTEQPLKKILLQNQTASILAKISQISNTGIVRIKFSKAMVASKEELASILNSTVYFNQKPMRILNLKLSNPNGVSIQVRNLTWEVVSYQGSILTLKLNFKHSEYVSIYQNKDSFQIEFLAFWLFHDASGNYVADGHTTQVAQIPAQFSPRKSESFVQMASTATSGFNALMASNAILQLLTAGSIQQLLSVMRTVQIISHMMLINLATPSNAQIFFSSLLNFVTMDLVPKLSAFAVETFEMDEVEGINSNFELFGYGSKLAFVNFGSASFLFLVVPLIAGVAAIVSKLKLNYLSAKAQQLLDNLFWNQIFGYCYEMYTVIAICSLMNVYYFRWDTTGNIINSVYCLVFAFITVGLPVFYSAFYFKNLDGFLKRDAKLVRRFGSLIQDLNLLRMGKQALYQPLVSMVRKLILICSLVIMEKKPLVSVVIVNFSSLAYGIVIGWYHPFKLQITNRMELINEFFTLCANYHLFCFTDFVKPEGKETMGYSLIYVTIANFVVSVGVILVTQGSKMLFKIKLLWKREKQARIIRIKNELEKKAKMDRLEAQAGKKKRLDNWNSRLEENFQRQPDSEKINQPAQKNESKQTELRKQRKNLLKKLEAQFQVERKAAEAELFENQIRQNLQIDAKMKPLMGTLNLDSEMSQNLFNSIIQQPWQYMLQQQLKKTVQTKIVNQKITESQQRLFESQKQNIQSGAKILDDEPIDHELILKIPAKLLYKSTVH